MEKHKNSAMVRTTLALAMGTALCFVPDSARSGETNDDQDVTSRGDAQAISADNPESSSELASTGAWLTSHGITPHLSVTQLYQANPSAGVQTGHSQALTLFSVGADYDARQLGVAGGTIHFEQLYVPFISNLNYRTQLGDLVSAIAAPYVPRVSHLHTFTYEQQLLHGRLTIEFGKSNAIYYFAKGLCISALTCQNNMLITGAGFNPFPYADWGARIAYTIAPRVRVQIGAWRSNANFFNHNGWQSGGDANDPMSSVFMGNIVYSTTYAEEPYPATFELLGYHNNGLQNDRVVSPAGRAATTVHDGTSGAYLGARKVIYRPNDGEGHLSQLGAVSAYGTWTHSFDPGVGNGISNQLHVGLIKQGLFATRPGDSYALSFDWGQLTKHRQRYNEEARLAMGEDLNTPGRNEYAVTLEANFVAMKHIVFSPYVKHTWNSNNWFNGFNRDNPSDGYTFGFSLRVGM